MSLDYELTFDVFNQFSDISMGTEPMAKPGGSRWARGAGGPLDNMLRTFRHSVFQQVMGCRGRKRMMGI